MYGTRHLFIFAIIICFVHCSPNYRFHRLVTKYPYLLDSVQRDKVIIRENLTIDSIFIWESQVDTIFFPQAIIERRNDTFRYYFRERPCTTYIQKTEVRPSKVIERYYQEKVEKREAWRYLRENAHWFLIIIFLLVLLILKT